MKVGALLLRCRRLWTRWKEADLEKLWPLQETKASRYMIIGRVFRKIIPTSIIPSAHVLWTFMSVLSLHTALCTEIQHFRSHFLSSSARERMKALCYESIIVSSERAPPQMTSTKPQTKQDILTERIHTFQGCSHYHNLRHLPCNHLLFHPHYPDCQLILDNNDNQ